MLSFRISITGDKEIDSRLRRLTSAQSKRIMQSAMRKAQKDVRKVMEARSPVGRTSELRKSFIIKAMKRSRSKFGVNVMINPNNEKLKPKSGKRKQPVFYPAIVEYGVKKGPRKRPANPWMRETFEMTSTSARDVALKAMRAGLEKLASK